MAWVLTLPLAYIEAAGSRVGIFEATVLDIYQQLDLMTATARDDARHDLEAGAHGDRQNRSVLPTAGQVLGSAGNQSPPAGFPVSALTARYHGCQALGFQRAYLRVETTTVFNCQLSVAGNQVGCATEATVLKAPSHPEFAQLRALDVEDDCIDFHPVCVPRRVDDQSSRADRLPFRHVINQDGVIAQVGFDADTGWADRGTG